MSDQIHFIEAINKQLEVIAQQIPTCGPYPELKKLLEDFQVTAKAYVDALPQGIDAAVRKRDRVMIKGSEAYGYVRALRDVHTLHGMYSESISKISVAVDTIAMCAENNIILMRLK